MSKKYDVLYKLLLIGDSGVGKTCLICRFTEDEFHNDHISTIGIDFKLRTIVIDGSKVRLQVWDTAGQERYETITKQYYRRAQGVFLVYDITNLNSFNNIRKWLTYVKEFADDDVSVMVLANKCDKSKRRRVTKEQGVQLAKELNADFCECSAKSKENINRAFEALARQIKQKKTTPDNDTVRLDMEDITHEDTSQLLRKDTNNNSNWCCSIM